MKTLPSSLRNFSILTGTILVASAPASLPVRALDNPINPNAPSPHSGVAAGHRAAGSFASRRPGNLPTYGSRPHSYTGVTSQTP